MTDDATLSEFVGETGETDGDDRDESGEDGSADDGSATVDRARSSADAETDGDGDDADATAGDSGLSTYAWGSYTCNRCDSDVERVWRQDGAFVCPDCKSW